jgi:isopentenyl-diphosphate delta-isomerase
LQSASKRLKEEMGFTTTLTKAFDFIYQTSFDNGLTEYEFDHVFTGIYDGKIIPNADEVADYCFKSIDEIKNSLLTHSKHFTAWFLIAFPKIESYLNQKKEE